MDNTTRLVNGRYEIGLPWKPNSSLSNNYCVALKQLQSSQKRLGKNTDLQNLDEKTLVTDLEKSYAQPAVFTKEVPSRLWYLPHHEVVSPNKPGKVRRVSNAASKFKGQTLNSNLLTCPDLLENLTGVLLRFRKFGIGTLADIEGMFMQISIKAEDRSSLHFLWDHKNVIRRYLFSRHIFGATCSPFCAIYILQKCAKDNIVNFPLAFESVKTNFYMDEVIHSASSPNVSSLIRESRISNSKPIGNSLCNR